ncbi:MAG: lysophospholipase [Deltaproteobacteria bacterium]|nr:lysophospholipase [Deltaproteobacteria bacterium]
MTIVPVPVSGTLSSFAVNSGLRLYYEWWVPRAPRAMLVVVHGLAEHSGRYGALVRHCVARGFGVALYDQRGHGQSDGPRGHFDHVQDLLSDLAQFVQFTKESHPGVPVILVGHSFGGQLALNFVVRYAKGLRGLIVSSPNIALKMKLAWWKRLCGEQLYRIAPRLRVGNNIDPRWLSNDPDVVRAFEQDPRICRTLTLHAAREIMRNLDVVMALASRIHIPALFLHAGDDRICDPEATRRFFRRVPVTRKRLKIYEGMQHEIFNEVKRAAVFADVEEWLTELLQTSPAAEARPESADEAAVAAPRSYTLGRGERWTGHGNLG